MEKVTVIIPVYNVEKYIHKCVESVMSQTFSNLEIILVDDGSPDRCPAICDEFEKKDSRIKVIHKQNGGLSDARNAGIDEATGEYLMFVDSDDYIAPTMVERLYWALKAGDADISICSFRYVDPDGKYDYEKENRDSPIRDEVLKAETILKEKIREDKSWYWIVAWCKLYKKSIFSTLRFRIGKLHEDEFIFHEIFLRADKVACISDKAYFYLQRSDSIMGKKINYKRLDGAEALLVRSKTYLDIPGYESVAVKELLSAASKFHGYYCSSHAKIDEKHRCRNIELQKEFRILFRKMLKQKVPMNFYDFCKLSVNYFSMYYSGKVIHHY